MLEIIGIGIGIGFLITGLVYSGYATARALWHAVRDRNSRAYRGR